MESVSRKLHYVVHSDDKGFVENCSEVETESDDAPVRFLQQYLGHNHNIKDLGLNNTQKKKLLNKLKDDQRRIMET